MRRYSSYFLSILILSLTGCGDSENPTIKEDPDPVFEGDPAVVADACYPAFEEDELNVATWNIKFFPQRTTTVEKVSEIIESLQADIIAVQEIAEPEEFVDLGEEIDNWNAVYADVRYGQELGFLYKESAFDSFGELTQLFDDDSYAFPRQAVMVEATHVSGLEVVLINIHLKCCGEDDSEEQQRRALASAKLQTYINDNLDDKAVILLGDFNDDITDGLVSPFQNFIDAADFTFADQAVANGDIANWSYPSWPSHLDHILISDELFDMVRGTQTLLLESCISNYSTTVSDHRPVLASFK
ncbi:endonuclease/exonuclease/phosphatase family protein [Ekhidna sp.]|uniref:endonuclease/exonuclease/phosphatase family protein n=1 Tax=Ekhidna sp. TaxID=2608089 RepID=UPI003299F8B1